jgi:hypothetical protein
MKYQLSTQGARNITACGPWCDSIAEAEQLARELNPKRKKERKKPFTFVSVYSGGSNWRKLGVQSLDLEQPDYPDCLWFDSRIS